MIPRGSLLLIAQVLAVLFLTPRIQRIIVQREERV
jgi:hypothetical protein